MGKRGPNTGTRLLKITEKRKRAFLKALRASGGVLSHAASVASPHAKPGTVRPCYSSFRKLALRDPQFNAAIEEVLQECRDDVEREITRRGQEGYTENVYQKGEQVFNQDGTPATTQHFSDHLLLARAKALMPGRYGDKRTVEISGTVKHAFGGGHWMISGEDIAALDKHQQARLFDLMATVRANRAGETPACRGYPWRGRTLSLGHGLISWRCEWRCPLYPRKQTILRTGADVR